MLTYLAALVVFFALAAAINAIVDPHGRLLLVDRAGFNSIKVTLPDGSRREKATVLRTCNFDTLIFGTSRAETLQLNEQVFEGKTVFNAALKAASMYEIRRLIEYSLEHQDLEAVILGLDLFSFHHKASTFDDFEQTLLAEEVSIGSLLKYLLSVQNLYESWVTFQWNANDIAVNCFQTGEYVWRGTKGAGQRTAFDFILKRYASGIYHEFDIGPEHYANLEAVLAELDAAGVRVYAFMTPMHALHIELMQEMGLLDKFHSWKRRVADIFASAGGETVLWDFTGFNRITTEPVPPEISDAKMRWYRDSSHFQPVVGSTVLNLMYGNEVEADPDFEGFGVRLTPDNVESIIAAERLGSERYRKDNPDELERMREMLKYAPYPQFVGF